MPDSPLFPFQNPEVPLVDRVRDLLGRMTIEEKLSQMNHISPSIERLGVPQYNWWNEALHGVARAGRATVFPQAIGLAATFDADLVFRVADAISTEARAKHHAAARAGNRGQYRGLTFWSPTINIFRDPRWGRGQETWGEDPVLTATLGTAFVRGMQGNHPTHLKTAACAKHYAVHSGPEALRHEFDAVVSKQDLYDTYLPAFEALAKAGVEAFMGAYNRTLGEPCCASNFLIRETLRGEWQFQGHYVSDCWAIQDFHKHHKVTQDAAESAALAVRMGCDLSCGCAYKDLPEALDRGLLTENDVDACVARLLRTRFRLGVFDPSEVDPYSGIPESVVAGEDHRALAEEAAVRSIVLLKNDGILPIANGQDAPTTIFVTGPNALDLNVLLGNYHGLSDRLISIVEGIVGTVGEGTTVEYRLGSNLDHPRANPIDWTAGEAGNADVVIAVVGLAPSLEGEEGDAIGSAHAGDRATIELPEPQRVLLQRLKEAGTPIVLILTGGAAVAMPEEHDLASAVLFVGYPGERGGAAIAKVLFGEANPSGKLPISFPMATADLPPFDDYSMDGRTYRYATKEPLYPFGFGLSYSRFRIASLEVKELDGDEGAFEAIALVCNDGPMHGAEVVQLYVSHLQVPFRVPLAALKAFQRVELEPGHSLAVRFVLTTETLSVIDPQGKKLRPEGELRVSVGFSSPSPRLEALGSPQPVTQVIRT